MFSPTLSLILNFFFPNFGEFQRYDLGDGFKNWNWKKRAKLFFQSPPPPPKKEKKKTFDYFTQINPKHSSSL